MSEQNAARISKARPPYHLG